MSRVLVAMSGGVDSSVAAALLLEAGHDVAGVTLKLWGGVSDRGCCSVADVEDARRVARQLGIDHHVFNFSDDFERDVVGPYVDAHRRGVTPNPCIECNRHLKFARLLERAGRLGFDAVATGHHARVTSDAGGRWELRRGADPAKDQSYVLHMLGQDALARTLLPVGSLTKAEVRARAAALGLATAAKPDSQDVCFVLAEGGRTAFLGERIPLRPGRVVDTAGRVVGAVSAVELVGIGQRRGLGAAGGSERRFAVEVDHDAAVVVVGTEADLRRDTVVVESPVWVGAAPAPGTAVLVQTSAHGRARPARWCGGAVSWDQPQRRVAPGQAVVLYAGDDPERVLGGATAR